MRIGVRFTVIAGLLLLNLAACSEAPVEPSIVESFMADPAAVARGKALFTGSCSGYCHKLTPEPGDALFLFDAQWKHGDSDQEIFDTVTNGVPDTRMIGFGTAFPEGDDDLWKVIAYLRVNQQTAN